MSQKKLRIHTYALALLTPVHFKIIHKNKNKLCEYSWEFYKIDRIFFLHLKIE